MTVLAFFNDFGIALSDVMVSIKLDQPTSVYQPIKMPSVPDGNYDVFPIIPVKLKRKIINVKCLKNSGDFLVSGTLSHIDSVVNNIKLIKAGILPISSYLSTLSTVDVVESACRESERLGKGDFELIGVCGGHRYSRQYDNNISGDIPYFGNVTLSGYGALSLLHWLNDRGEQLIKLGFSEESVEKKAFRTANWLPAMLLEEDRRPFHNTLREGVGGYYEVYYFLKNGLVPDDDVLTIFINIDKIRTGIISIGALYYHIYLNENLFILSFNGEMTDFPIDDGISIPLSNFDLFNIQAIYGDNVIPEMSKSLLAMKMGNAKSFRLSLLRENGNQSKRGFSSELKIIKTLSKDRNVHISINKDIIMKYLEDFPIRPRAGQKIIYSRAKEIDCKH